MYMGSTYYRILNKGISVLYLLVFVSPIPAINSYISAG